MSDPVEVGNGWLESISEFSSMTDDDNDGLFIKLEQFLGTSDTKFDTDRDGISDYEEFKIYQTDPLNWDTDKDELFDGVELAHGLNPFVDDSMSDLDGDGYPNIFEIKGRNGDVQDRDVTPEVTHFVSVDGSVGYSSLQAATDAIIENYSIISVGPGTYTGPGNIDFSIGSDRPAILIISDEGATTTVLDGEQTYQGPSIFNSESALVGFTIRNCVGNLDGGGLVIGGDHISVANCEIYGNSTVGNGAGIYVDASNVRIENTIITGNIADSNGGGIYTSNPLNMEIVHSTLYGNTASLGSELYVSDDPENNVALVNSIVWNGNTDAKVISGGTVSASNCIIQGTTGYHLNKGWIINEDPLLTTEGRLTADSKAIDRVSGSVYADIDGQMRPYGGAADIGADEAIGTVHSNGDTDGDGLRDWWEIFHFPDTGISLIDPADNPDNDGLVNLEEFYLFALPNLADTDGDGLDDGEEMNLYGTNLLISDSDSDGFNDGWEVRYGFNPNVMDDGDIDSDKDGVLNGQEYASGGNPWVADTDRDEMPDIFEYKNGLNLALNDRDSDKDNDGLSNYEEFTIGTQANYFDSDDDLLSDGWEVEHGLDPLVANDVDADDDDDGIDTFDEYQFGTNPFIPDTDGDGTNDGVEIRQGSNANDPNDGGQAPEEDNLQEVSFSVGDPSGSHSERWAMNIQGLGPDTRQLKFSNREFGSLGTKVFKLWRDTNYRITLNHVGSKNAQPDYDWEATIDGLPTTTVLGNGGTNSDSDRFALVGNWIIDNESGLLGVVNQSFDSENFTEGKEALLLKVDLVTINTFIRQNNVNNPFNFFPGADKIFHGDNRGFNENGSYRTQQKFNVVTQQAADPNGLQDNAYTDDLDGNHETRNATGITAEYDKSSSLDSNGNLTQAARDDTILNDGFLKIDQGQAGIEDMSISSIRLSDGKVKIVCIGSAADPLISNAPSLDYNFTITIDRTNPSVPTYSLTGSHDGFPDYEVYINNTRVFEFDAVARGQTSLSLFGSGDWNVEESKPNNENQPLP